MTIIGLLRVIIIIAVAIVNSSSSSTDSSGGAQTLILHVDYGSGQTDGRTEQRDAHV
jgi:hypothetical protein